MISKKVSIEDMLKVIGEFGRFQQLLLALVCLGNMYGSQVVIMYFAGLNPSWKCSDNSSVCLLNNTFPNDNKTRCSMNREDWKYIEKKEYSVTTQFDLVCEKEWLSSFASSIFFLGWMVGGMVLGWFADNFGRRTILIPSTVFFILIGSVTSFSPNISVFLVLRFIEGFLVPGCFLQSFVIVTEYIGNKYRPFVGVTYIIFFSLNICQLGVIASFVREWKYIFILTTAPYSFIVFLFPFIPESAKWLLANGQKETADRIFENIAKWNKKKIAENISVYAAAKKRKTKPWDLFKTKKTVISTLIQGYSWMIIAMIFYSLTFAVDDIGGSLYMNFFILHLMSGLPVLITLVYCCDRLGRKKTIIASLILTAASCLLLAFLSEGHTKTAVAIIGKFFVTNSFFGVYIWSAEILPTIMRSEGMRFLQGAARIGSAMAPIIVKVLIKFNRIVPFVLLGVLACIAFGLSFCLPETKFKIERVADDTCPIINSEVNEDGYDDVN